MFKPVWKVTMFVAVVACCPLPFAMGQDGVVEEMVVSTHEDVEFRRAVLSLIDVVERHGREINTVNEDVKQLNQRFDGEIGSLRAEMKSLEAEIRSKIDALHSQPKEAARKVDEGNSPNSSPPLLTSIRVVSSSNVQPVVRQRTISFNTARGQVTMPIVTVNSICPHCRLIASSNGQNVYFRTCNQQFVALARY